MHYFQRRQQKKFIKISRLTINTFNSFVAGKAVDSLIIGILCYIILSFMNMPYTPLISVLVGVTNMIPVFGPFLGAVPSILILLLVDPFRALEFAIFILILQQVGWKYHWPTNSWWCSWFTNSLCHVCDYYWWCIIWYLRYCLSVYQYSQ